MRPPGPADSGRRYHAPVIHAPKALTLDLDDTLWPIAPAIAAAEAALATWLAEHAPAAATRWPTAAIRALRDDIARDRSDLAHDFTAQRRLCIAHVLAESGEDAALADAAFDAFFAARNRVACFPGAIDALHRLSGRFALAALTNGNADLDAIGLSAHFRFCLSARDHGAAKPSPCIFLAACTRLGHDPRDVLHVGDDPEMDVAGAAAAGLATCWINRPGADGLRRAWPSTAPAPDLEFDSVAALADWLDATHPASTRPAESDRSAA
jgi:putative hydrolase of the HAD superfamily